MKNSEVALEDIPQQELIISLRKNASIASIDKAKKELIQKWEASNKANPDRFVRQPTAYLILGDVYRWGYRSGVWAWGFGKNNIDREIAGMLEARSR